MAGEFAGAGAVARGPVRHFAADDPHRHGLVRSVLLLLGRCSAAEIPRFFVQSPIVMTCVSIHFAQRSSRRSSSIAPMS